MAYVSSSDTFTKTVTITSAQVLALRATPITLVPAPDHRIILEFVRASVQLDYNSIAYAEGAAKEDNLVVRYTDGSGLIVSEEIEMTGFIDQTVDMFTLGFPALNPILAKTDVAGKKLVLHNVGDEELTLGDSPLVVDIVYRAIQAV